MVLVGDNPKEPTVTEEMVEAGARKLSELNRDIAWDLLTARQRRNYLDSARACLHTALEVRG